MKIVTIVGARPQFIKAAAVSRAIKNYNSITPSASHIDEILVHTGQHYDNNMSDIFFEELEIPRPDFRFAITASTHGAMTGGMLTNIERVLIDIRPDAVMVYGDTNTTLSGALAAVKLQVPVIHVEAGLRSFNWEMPEEINRVITDRVSSILFCPTETAVKNLRKEGITKGIFNVGDVMCDALLYYYKKERGRSIIEKLALEPKNYALATIHRAENTDNLNRLTSIMDAFSKIADQTTLIIPLHPRTRKIIEKEKMEKKLKSLKIIEPVSYLEMINLEAEAKAVLTDSGGVQKEVFMLRTPCITLRDETEWVETLEFGANVLTGTNVDAILTAYQNINGMEFPDNRTIFGIGNTAEIIVKHIVNDI